MFEKVSRPLKCHSNFFGVIRITPACACSCMVTNCNGVLLFVTYVRLQIFEEKTSRRGLTSSVGTSGTASWVDRKEFRILQKSMTYQIVHSGPIN